MFIEKIRRDDGDLYLTRIRLTPATRWGWLQLHIFARGDTEGHCHDHPFNFWTFPLHDYIEEVEAPLTGTISEPENHPAYTRGVQVVERFKWHYRPAIHRHRVIGRPAYSGPGRLWTLMWRTPKYRDWGFFVDGEKIPWHVYRNAPSM